MKSFVFALKFVPPHLYAVLLADTSSETYYDPYKIHSNVRADIADFRAHPIQQLAKLLNMRLGSGVAQNRRPLRQDAGHDRVFSSGDARFVEQDIRAGVIALLCELYCTALPVFTCRPSSFINLRITFSETLIPVFFSSL